MGLSTLSNPCFDITVSTQLGHLYLSQPGAEHSLTLTVALHLKEVHFNNQAMAAMGVDHSHLCPPLKNEMKLCMDKE